MLAFDCTIPVMGKKKDAPVTKRLPPVQTYLHPLLRQQLEELVKRNASDMSEEVRIAIRERLERAGLWPPKNG